MPFAKGVLRAGGEERTPPPDAAADTVFREPRSSDEVFHGSLVGASRQLTALLLLAGQLFDELITDCRLIGDRTDRLRRRIEGVTDAVDRLDAKTASIPEGSIHVVVQVTRHFEADYAYRSLLIFDPSSRPISVQELYSRAEPTPVEHIREIDCYRTDGIRGTQIFSRNPVAINKWVDDFCPTGNIQAKYRVTPSPETRKIRPLQSTSPTESTPERSNSQRNSAKVDDGNVENDDLDEVFTREEYFPASSDLQAVLVVEIDVTGAGFGKLCELHARSHAFETKEDSYYTASLVRYKKTTRRPKTITGISDLVFQEVDIDLPSPKHSSSAKAKSIHRRSLKKLSSQTLEIYAPKETGKSQKKRACRYPEEDDSKLCSSFRHSLKSVFRLSRSKSKDLWNTAAAEETSNKSEMDFFALRRSLSLPRSLKSSTKLFSFGSYRSSSVEGHLNHRILSAEQISANSLASLSRLRKPVVPERRSLTKSLSQIRLGRSSRSKKNFGRPQSMEIRMPQLDEDGRSMLSLCNSSAINMSSTVTIASGNKEAHPWMKSLSNMKLRKTENQNSGSEYQLSSGQWSGGSGFTEKQLHDSGRQSSGSVQPFVQSSSDTSFSTKDSAMCLHFNPGERDSSTQNQKICEDMGLLQTKIICQNENHSSVAEQQTVMSSPKILDCRRISDSLSRTHHHRDADDENCRSLSVGNSTSHFSRAAKSSSSAKSKSSYRSSFMMKLKKLAKPNKLEASITSPTSLSPSFTSTKTMGDCVSGNNEAVAQSLTPRLPRAQFEELRKLSELAERMASSRAMSKVPSVSCGPLSGHGCGVQRDKILDCHLIPFGEVHKNLHSNVLNSLSFKDDIHNYSQNIPGTSSNSGPSVSMSKLDQRTAAKGQKLNELESILETSHECESLSPSTVRSKQSSSGKFCAKLPNQLSLPAVQNSTENIFPTVSSYSEDLDIANRLEGKDERLIGTDADESSSSEISASESSILSVLPLSIDNKDVVIACQFDPSPATARLIISSPMLDRAFYIDNPHKRLLCQALSHAEFAKFSAVDVRAGQFLSKNKSHFIYPEISSVSKQSLDFLKRSSWSSFIIGEGVDLSNYGQLHYNGIAEPHPDHSSLHPFDSSVEFSKEISNTTSSNSNVESNSLKHQNSSSTRTKEDRCLNSTSACINVLTNSLNDLTVAACSVKSAPDKKCARVIYPYVETGQPFASHSALKHNVGSQRPFTSVNILKLDPFAGNTVGNYRPTPEIMYHLSNGGGTLKLKKSSISNDAQVFRSSTLPRSYQYAPGERRSLAFSAQH